MQNPEKQVIKVSVAIDAPVEKVWKLWISPYAITGWYNASPDWHTPRASNDLRSGGSFNFRMEAKDGSAGFDFSGVYTTVVQNEHIASTLDDGRKVVTEFSKANGGTRVTQLFEAEDENTPELQQAGWQAILDNFALYVKNH